MSWEFSNFTRKFGNSYSLGGIKGLSREPKFYFSKICIITSCWNFVNPNWYLYPIFLSGDFINQTWLKCKRCTVPVELFYIEIGCSSRTEIWERDIYILHACKLHLEQGHIYSHLSPSPPTPASNRRDKRGRLALFPAPPLYPCTPHAEFMWFSASSAKSEDGLYLGAQKYYSWIWTAFVIMYEFEVKW